MGTVAVVIVVASPFLAAPFGWGAGLVALLLLGIAVVLLGIGMLRAGVLPVTPLVLFVAGPVAWILLAVAVEATNSNGSWAMFTPLLLTMLGFSWLGWYQWNEPALDSPATNDPLAAA